VRMTVTKRPLRQRVVALAAAYAIALAGLIASFDTAQAVAEATAQPDVVICHSGLADEPAPGPQDSNGNFCIKFCVGCITSLAMAIPPTVSSDRLPQSAIKRLDLPAPVVRVGGAKFSAHRSRGPPPVL
jgi:hypothetical protein